MNQIGQHLLKIHREMSPSRLDRPDEGDPLERGEVCHCKDDVDETRAGESENFGTDSNTDTNVRGYSNSNSDSGTSREPSSDSNSIHVDTYRNFYRFQFRF